METKKNIQGLFTLVASKSKGAKCSKGKRKTATGNTAIKVVKTK